MRTGTSLAAVLVTLLGSALAATPTEAQVVTGTFAPNELYQSPDPNSPPSESRFFVRTIGMGPRESALVLPVSGGGGLIVWTVPLRAGTTDLTPIETTLTTPSGARLRAREASSRDQRLRRMRFQGEELDLPGDASLQEVIHVARAEAGIYTLDVRRRDPSDPVTVVVAEPESTLVMVTTAGPLSRRAGEPVTLRARLREGDSPLADARVTARVAAPLAAAFEPVQLFDDGRHGDGAAGDGAFATTVTELGDAAGLWSVRFEADGVAEEGRPFARTGSAGFVTEPVTARLAEDAINATVVETDSGHALRVEATARVELAGQYRLDVIVAGDAGANGQRRALVWGESTRTLAQGSSPLSIEIPLTQSRSENVLHCDIRLLALDPMGLAGRATVDLVVK